MINGGSNENNVQYTDITNNYWGCPEGPVVVYKKDYNKNTGTYPGWAYRYWARQRQVSQ